ncbi:MAG: flagellar biosynthesis anti-sigma factor FlgM [Deltaproteobacteria bacterium]|nr:flagellar biosynthesis anti-sigma factor FlgM [Deltaproteobacteria bacterium]
MKIDVISQRIGQIANLETYTSKKAEEENKPAELVKNTPQPGARVDLSDASVEFSRAAEMMEKVPEERAEKIEKLTAQVREGTYNVDAERIAEGIINDTIANMT